MFITAAPTAAKLLPPLPADLTPGSVIGDDDDAAAYRRHQETVPI